MVEPDRGRAFSFRGTTWQLPDRWIDGTAIHGLVARRAWRVASQTPTTATLAIDIDEPPWTLSCEQGFHLDAAALIQHISLTNNGDEPVPVGIGIHPWFPTGELQVPAALVWPDENCIPTGPPRPVRPEEDLRTAVIPPPMDSAYTGLTGSTARVGDIELSWTGPITQVIVYTEDPGWICVEPVTNANDGFNLLDRGQEGHGVVILEPSESTEVTYTFRWL